MRRPSAFISGICGFAGSWLAEELITEGYKVYGNRYKNESTAHIAHLRKNIELAPLDITNSTQCVRLVGKVKPDYLFHLAAMASVGKSFGAEQLTLRTNLDGTANILEASRLCKRLKRLVVVSSADCYGMFSPKNKTLNETQPLNPITPYAIAKAAAERLANYYFRQYNVPLSIARSFNHTGPRQDDRFVVASFAKQLAAIEAGAQKPVLKVGDLSARRDFSDVRDIVRGYRLISQKGKPGETYLLCSGRAVSIQQMLNMLLKLSHERITIKEDPKRMRKADIPLLRGNNGKAKRKLGFSNRVSLKETLADTLNYWRDQIHQAD